MKALILAAGFGTRLERDLKASAQHAHLIGVPKPLLPIGDYPLITHWIQVLDQIPAIETVYVVTNGVNHAQFEAWSRDWAKVTLVCDGCMSNDTRTGAVGCMRLAVDSCNIQDDLIVIAGDTLFYEDFSLEAQICRFEENKARIPGASMLLYVNCSDAEVHKYGILETDADTRVTAFLEKPQPHETSSRKQCPCFYFLNRESLGLLAQFLDENKDKELKARDATGNFVAYLYQRQPVYAVEISGRFDVGGLESYLLCHQYFTDKYKP